MDASKAEFVGLAVTSGAVAGVANQLARFIHDWLARRFLAKEQREQLEHQSKAQSLELAHQKDLQDREISHQRQVRAEDAFYTARDNLIDNAVEAFSWIQWTWGADFGAEVDYYPINSNRPKVQTAADAITALNEIAGKHPKKAIRDYAQKLADSIDAVFNMPKPDGSVEPGVDDYAYWTKCSEQLIDALHDPDYLPQAVGRSS